MIRRRLFPATTLAVACGVATPATAQNCYDNPTQLQCFSFAPPPEMVEKLDTGISLRSEKFRVTGDIRLRLRGAAAPSDAPYNTNSQQATRARVQFSYQVNEWASALLEYNFSETWAGSGGYSDAQPGENWNGIAQAYFEVNDLAGLEDKWRIGRSYYILANGMILGSCDFLQYPNTFTGAWVSKEFSGHSVELFVLDDNGPLHVPVPATRYAGATGKINIQGEDGLVESLNPWFMAGTNDGDGKSSDSWYGFQTSGRAPLEIDWSFQWALRDRDAADNITAYRARVDRAFDGIFNGISFTRTDSEGAMHVNPADFNTAGLIHQYGGAWRRDLVTNQLGLSFRPGADIDLDMNLLNFDGPGATGGEYEADVMAGKQLKQGLYVWAGYGIDDEERQVGYLQLTLYF